MYIDKDSNLFESPASQDQPLLHIEDPMLIYNIDNNVALSLLPHVWERIGLEALEECFRYTPERVCEMRRNPSLADLAVS